MQGSNQHSGIATTPHIRVGDRLRHADDEWIVEAVRDEMLTVRSDGTTDHWSTNYVEYAGMRVIRPPEPE